MCLLLRQVVMFGGGEQSDVALEPRHLFSSSKTLYFAFKTLFPLTGKRI